jgi:hypothetical protein
VWLSTLLNLSRLDRREPVHETADRIAIVRYFGAVLALLVRILIVRTDATRIRQVQMDLWQRLEHFRACPIPFFFSCLLSDEVYSEEGADPAGRSGGFRRSMILKPA